MNTQFIFDNIIIFPVLALIVTATYIIQYCSVISPCCIEFDEDSRTEMRLMNRYNIMSDNAFTVYISGASAGVAVSLLTSSVLLLIFILVAQVLYLLMTGTVMILMYGRSKKYWKEFHNADTYTRSLNFTSHNLSNT